MNPWKDGRAREGARLVARAEYGVIPIRTDTDAKAPKVEWTKPWEVCRSEADVVRRWSSQHPRWAVICGKPRVSDGRALICLDADSAEAVALARELLPDHTRVRTGRPEGGEHTWMALPSDHALGKPLGWRLPLLHQFFLAPKLDWRGGNVIALLPGSLWAPVSAPGVTYDHIAGPALPDVLDVPVDLAEAVRDMAPAQIHNPLRPGSAPSGPIDLSAEGAYEKFLAAITRSGRKVQRQRPGEAYVQCPGAAHPHGNRKPALHVTARGGGIGLYCFARRCSIEEIVTPIGLTKADAYNSLGGFEIEFVK